MKKFKIIIVLLLIVLMPLFACRSKNKDLEYTFVIQDEATLSSTEKSSKTLPTASMTNREFIGWYTENGTQFANSEGNIIVDTNNYTSPLKLFARWDKADITFLGYDDSPYKNITINTNSKISFPSKNPTKEPDDNYAYTFIKWDIDDEAIITSDTTVKSVWEKEQITWASSAKGINPRSKKMYKLAYIFKESLFNSSSTTFSKDLMMFAYGQTLSAGQSSSISYYFNSINFDDIYISPTYLTPPTDTSIAFCFAHKKIGETDCICVVIRGSNYEQEWANNFYVGLEGDHNGFANSATQVKNSLMEYLSKYDLTNVKVLLTGYSRGGGVANVLAHQILSTSTSLNTSNLYAYTFEAPCGVKETNNMDYPNVFNLVNYADIVCHIAPYFYGFRRCGIDINIYSQGVDDLLKASDYNMLIPQFEAKNNVYNNEIEFPTYLLDSLMNYMGDNSLNTRKKYNDNYQDSICYLIKLYESLKSSTIENITKDISQKSMSDLLAILASDNGLYNYLKPFIQKDGVSYQENLLAKACSDITNLIKGPGSQLLTNISISNISRMLAMHMSEVTYVLIEKYYINN